MDGKRSLLLGLFFLVSLSVLAYYTLFLTDFTLLRDRPELRVHFSETNGLREGDSVLVAGMRWGRVKKLIYDPNAPQDRRITMVASLNEPLVLRAGFKIEIEETTLLGGRNVSIEPGPAGAAQIAANADLAGEVGTNPLKAVGDLLEDSQKGVKQIIEDLQGVTSDLREGRGALGRLLRDPKIADDLAEIVSTASSAMRNIREISARLNDGTGTAGMFLKDDSLYKEIRESVGLLTRLLRDASAIAGDVRGGQGLAGAIVTDNVLSDKLSATLSRLESIARKIDEGSGSVGLFVNDPGLYQDAARIMHMVADGQGTIGAFVTRPELYDSLRLILDDVSVVTNTLRSGQGSFGRLIMDEEIYQQLKTAMQIVQRSLEEFREAAPITTFTSVFFAAF